MILEILRNLQQVLGCNAKVNFAQNFLRVKRFSGRKAVAGIDLQRQ